MKAAKFLFIAILSFFAFSFSSCEKDDEDPKGIVNFEEEAIDRNTDDLSPIEVEFSIDPPAPKDTEFSVSISGAEAGTVFETTPSISDGVVSVPVNKGDRKAEIVVTPLEEGIGYDDIVLAMEIASPGDGLTTGITITSQINIVNAKDTGEPLPFLEDFAVCGPDGEGSDALPPEGWKQEVVQQNAEGSAVWQCIGEYFGETGIQINAFVNNSEDQTSSEVWMVSPRINLLEASAPKLSFNVDRRFDPTDSFTQDHYDIVISTDYNGLNFGNSTWERFEPGYDAMAANDPSQDNMENTGELDLSEYAGKVISIGFIYRAGAPGSFDATVLRIGDVAVSE